MKAVIIGATGYGGAELIRLLMHHPQLEISGLVSSSQVGKEIKKIYPHLHHLPYLLDALDVESIADRGDLIFFATPAGVSSKWAPLFVEKGKIVIDLSGDFRLHEESLYQSWYGKPSAPKNWLDRAVYGLSEWFRDNIAHANLIANPGCYPTAILLALAPLLEAGWIKSDSIIIDAKSGVTGGGRTAHPSMIYSELNENLRPYKVDRHQHIPEIEQFSTYFAKQDIKVNFTPHLVPMNRGILVTLYMEPVAHVTVKELQQLYQETYQTAPFVRVMSEGWPQTKQVQGSNFCDIGFHLDERTGRLILLSAIDNLMKGAAGQAVQNANIRLGYAEETGLMFTPLYP